MIPPAKASHQIRALHGRKPRLEEGFRTDHVLFLLFTVDDRAGGVGSRSPYRRAEKKRRGATLSPALKRRFQTEPNGVGVVGVRVAQWIARVAGEAKIGLQKSNALWKHHDHMSQVVSMSPKISQKGCCV